MSIQLNVREVSNEEMSSRVAYFATLPYNPERYADSNTPGNERKNFAVVGPGLEVEGGKDAMAAIPIEEGLTVSYIACTPGNGPVLHVHDTNETFIPFSGRWRIYWSKDASNFVDLGPLDIVSVPSYVPRRFENITDGPSDVESVLVGVLAGSRPQVMVLDN